MLTANQFQRLCRLADRLAGIALQERHRESIGRRLARLGWEAEAILDAAEQGGPDAHVRLISILTTNHTAFFRRPHQIDLAAEHALWAAHRRGSARLWSVAASTGEEPWSLAMAAMAVFGRDDPPVSVLATDIDAAALAKAEAGVYGSAAVAAIPEEHRRWLEGGRIAPSVRALVRFVRLNLVDLDWPVAGPFDVVCCRNVLMYLGADHRYAVLERLAGLMAADGMLLLDPSEHLGSAAPLFAGGAGGAYTLQRNRMQRRHGP